MTEIRSVNAPAIGQKGVDRLFALVREQKMTPEGGAFQAGQEQAKREFRDALHREVGIPTSDKEPEPAQHLRVPLEEVRARKAGSTRSSWWGSKAPWE